MRSLATNFLVALTGLTLALGASGCGPSMDGSWYQAKGTTPLPAKICGDNCLLDVEATMELDEQAKEFKLNLNMAYTALHDTIDTYGTFETSGSDMTLTFEGFTIGADSSNKASVAEDGSQCIVLKGFASTTVCFPSPQTHEYTLEGDTLTVTIDNTIAGADVSQTVLVMTRQP